MIKQIFINQSTPGLIAAYLGAAGNKELLLTTTLNLVAFASKDHFARWLNILEQAGYVVKAFRYDSLEALSRFDPALTPTLQLALLDDSLPGEGGSPFSILQAFQAFFPHIPAIVIAEQPTFTGAVAAVKAGARGYLPGYDLSKLDETIREVLAETDNLKTREAYHHQDDVNYRQMFENNSAVKLLIDPATGVIVDANEAACRFYGYPRSQMVKLNIDQINTLSPDEVKAEMAKAESDQRLYFEFRHRDATGIIHDVEVRSSPLFIEGRRLLYSVIHDISERKQMEKAQGFMTTVSQLLGSTVKYETVLNDVARAAVPVLADACLVFLRQPDGSFNLHSLAAVDRATEARFMEWFEDYPVSLDDVMRVVGTITGQGGRIAGQFDPGHTGEESPSKTAKDFYEALQINSCLSVALNSQDQLQGVMGFIYSVSGRTYNEVDVRLAEGIARRVSLSIENARHYEDARQAAASEKATRQELETLASLLTHQADELNAVIEAMADGIFICDASGELTRMNPRAIEILGLNNTEDPIASYEQLKVFYLDGRPITREERPLAQALRGVTNTDFREMTSHGITGQTIQLRASFAPIRAATGEIRGGVSIMSDITELQRLEKQKEEFLTIASHELKTPITSIKGLTQLAIRRLKRAGIVNEVTTLQSVEKQVDRMVELINDMLDTRRVQHGRLELQFQPFNFAGLVRETAQALQVTTALHNISVDAPEELIVTGDAHRLEQVLNNLLTNAIKYSPKGGPIKVKLAEQSGMAVVSVRDHGIGIPEKDRQNLFQPFHRASNVSLYEVAGFGLGLYLCSEIMKAHHGRLWLEDAQALDEPGADAEVNWDEQAANSGVQPSESGSTFCFSLPIDLPPN